MFTNIRQTPAGNISRLLGDPRCMDHINPSQLKKGDVAVLAIDEGDYGAIYFLRPKPDDKLEHIAKPREILGVLVMTCEGASHERARQLLDSFAKDIHAKVKRHLGKDMDGAQDVFYVFV